LRLRAIESRLRGPIFGYSLIEIFGSDNTFAPQLSGAIQFTSRKLQTRSRAFELSGSLCEFDFIGDWVDDEQEISLVDDIAILEMDFGQGPANLGAELDLVDCGELTKEA
jgi:hypothetical protein